MLWFVFQVHSLFSLLGLSHAYVTSAGKLIGVCGLKDVSILHIYWFDFKRGYKGLRIILIALKKCTYGPVSY